MSRPASPGVADKQANIPDKLYFKIGEVSAIAGVEPHVLRYWESEIKLIRPQRATSKQRLYRRIDVENILFIKKLLYEDGYTIPGARKYLAANRSGAKLEKNKNAKTESGDLFGEIKTELEALKKMLEEP